MSVCGVAMDLNVEECKKCGCDDCEFFLNSADEWKDLRDILMRLLKEGKLKYRTIYTDRLHAILKTT